MPSMPSLSGRPAPPVTKISVKTPGGCPSMGAGVKIIKVAPPSEPAGTLAGIAWASAESSKSPSRTKVRALVAAGKFGFTMLPGGVISRSGAISPELMTTSERPSNDHIGIMMASQALECGML